MLEIESPSLKTHRSGRIFTFSGGDMASTWVANLWVHVEGQITS